MSTFQQKKLLHFSTKKITRHKESEKCDPLAEEKKKQAMEAAIESNQILDLITDKDFRIVEEQKTQDI